MDMVINKVTSDNVDAFWRLLERYSSFVDREYYERCLERQDIGDLDIYVVSLPDAGMVGHCILNWIPRYAMFKTLGLPEIQDLNVVSDYRRRGIGQALIEYCEDYAAQKGHDTMGIGVGLDHSFGAAQRLYVRLGYVPDGNGVTYDRQPVAMGDFKPIDENLSLMMTKSLKN